MDGAFAYVIVAAVVVYLLYFFVSSSGRSGRREDRQHHSSAASFEVVSIVPGETPCKAVSSISRLRFLASEAPSLPVLDCDCTECTCTYLHHGDRRQGIADRRKSKEGWSLFGHGESSDRRQVRGRRRSDWGPLAT